MDGEGRSGKMDGEGRRGKNMEGRNLTKIPTKTNLYTV